MKARAIFIDLKEHLLAAARAGKMVKIRLPFYQLGPRVIAEEEVDEIARDMRRAGQDYFERNDYNGKRHGG